MNFFVPPKKFAKKLPPWISRHPQAGTRLRSPRADQKCFAPQNTYITIASRLEVATNSDSIICHTQALRINFLALARAKDRLRGFAEGKQAGCATQ